MENENTRIWCESKGVAYGNLGSFDRAETIYHYTSPQGLLGILENKNVTFWFSRYDCMNDISEGKNVLEVYNDVCEELISEKKIGDNFYENIKGIKIDDRESFKTQDNTMICIQFLLAEKYICCFSKNHDSLPMWNYYTKSGKCEGYNIGVFLGSMKASSSDNYIFELCKVIYKDSEKKGILQTVIEEYYEKYRNGFLDLHTVKVMIAGLLKKCSLFFKNSCFQHKEEIRAVISIPRQDEKQQFEIKYRPVNGNIVPYIEVPFSKEIIHEIMIGPLLKDKIALNTMNDLLKNRGYHSVEVLNSNIPIRY